MTLLEESKAETRKKRSRMMANTTGIPQDELRAHVRRLGLDLSSKDMETVKQLYDHHAPQIKQLNDLDLGAEDLAVLFPPRSNRP